MQPPGTGREQHPPAAPATDPAAGSGTAEAPGPADALTADSFRFTGLSWPARLLICLAVGVVVTVTTWHLTASFLTVAPSNTVSEKYEDRVSDYITPEFEQNWKLFAPNPLQTDIHVEVRAEVLEDDGSRTVTDWINLSAYDFEHIAHNPFPSHTAQNQLRRAWEFYRGTLDDDGLPTGTRGELAETYLHRLALLRVDQDDAAPVAVADIERLQLRSASTPVAAPSWSAEEIDTTTTHHELDWRLVLPEDLPSGAVTDRAEEPTDGALAPDAAGTREPPVRAGGDGR